MYTVYARIYCALLTYYHILLDTAVIHGLLIDYYIYIYILYTYIIHRLQYSWMTSQSTSVQQCETNIAAHSHNNNLPRERIAYFGPLRARRPIGSRLGNIGNLVQPVVEVGAGSEVVSRLQRARPRCVQSYVTV